MKAVVTSIGEPTTQLCIWALDRQGYDVRVYMDQTSLANKLKRIYSDLDEDFIRVDADVIVNRNIKRLGDYQKDAWWIQGQCYGWFAQDLVYGGIQLIRKQALPYLRANIGKHLKALRPESDMFRLPEFHDPRRCVSVELLCGLHGYGQDDIRRVRELKVARGQIDNYDFELAERISAL